MIAASQKQKGPAEAATSPDHGSSNPLEGSSMNVHSNTTAAAPAASPPLMTARDALSDLETMVYDVKEASVMLGFIIDSLFHMLPDDGACYFKVGKYEADVIAFAQRTVSCHASDIVKRWNELNDRLHEERCGTVAS